MKRNVRIRNAVMLVCFLVVALKTASFAQVSGFCRPDSQVNGAYGVVCAACTIINPGDAIDQDTSTFSVLNVTAGIASGLYQQLIFRGSMPAGTPVRIKIGVATGILDMGVLSGVEVASYDGSTYNNDRKTVTGGSGISLTLLGANEIGYITFTPVTSFDRIELRVDGGLLGVNTQLRIYHAFQETEIPSITGGNSQTICEGETAEFTVASPVSGYSYYLFADDTTTSVMDSGTTVTSTPLNTSTTLYLEARGPLGCAGNRVPLTVTVNPAPAKPVVSLTNDTICNGDSVMLSATAVADVEYSVYDSPNGGVLLGTLPLTVHPIANTIYYAEAKNTVTGCLSVNGRATFSITVNPRPAAPTSVSASDDTTCSGDSVTILAAGAGAGIAYRIYSSSTGMGIVGTTPFKVAPTSNTTYYIGAVSASGCTQTAARTSVSIVVLPLPPDPSAAISNDSICAGDSAIITASGGGAGVTYEVFNAANGVSLGTTPLTVKPASSAIYFVYTKGGNFCLSNSGVTLRLTVFPQANVPLVSQTDDTVCRGGQVNIDVTNKVAGVTYRVYDSSTGGTMLGTIPYIATVNATVTYHIEATSNFGCSAASSRTAVNLYVFPSPATPSVTVSSDTICAGDSVTIQASGITPNVTLSVYNQATGGVMLGSIPFYATPAASTDYYVESTSENGCHPLGGRVKVAVVVNPVPPAPSVSLSSDTICRGDSVLVSASGSGSGVTYEIRNAAGTFIGVPPMYLKPASTTTYSLIARNASGCISDESAAKATITVNELPALPVLISNHDTLCQGDTANIRVNTPQAGVDYHVYSGANGGISLGKLPYQFVPSVNTTLYIEAVSKSGCGQASARVPFSVVVLSPGTVVATNDFVTVMKNTSVIINVAANDAGGSAATVLAVSFPGHGTAVPVGTGNFEYTPAHDFAGTDFFRYRICDKFCANVCDTAQVTIRVSSGELVFYNGVTANNDGVNEFFEVVGMEILQGNNLTIYNRWGNVIYETSSYRNNWNGQCNRNCGNDDVVSGTYYYLFEAIFPDGRKTTYKGFIDIQK